MGLLYRTHAISSLAILVVCLFLAPTAYADSILYVCNQTDCQSLLPAGSVYHRSLTEAINAAAKDPADGPYFFWLWPDTYVEAPSIPPALQNAFIGTYQPRPENLTSAAIGGLVLECEASPFNLRLDWLIVTPLGDNPSGHCFYMDTTATATLSLTNVTIECSSIVMLGSSSALNILDSITAAHFQVLLGNSSYFYAYDNDIWYLNLSLAAHATVQLQENWFHNEVLISGRNSSLYAWGNGFMMGVWIASNNSSLKFVENWFSSHLEPARFNSTLGFSLGIAVQCSIELIVSNNTFNNGTFQIYDVSNREHCSLDIAETSRIKYNVFSKPVLDFRVYDLLRLPAEPAMTASTGKYVMISRRNDYFPDIIDATLNWWGDPSGPYLCCNMDGSGAYTSLYVNTSDWCTTPTCAHTSGIRISDECVTQGCHQRLSTAGLIVFWLSFFIGSGVLLAGMAFNIYHSVKHFNIHSFQNHPIADLLPKAHKQWRIGMIVSSLGSIIALLNVLIPFFSVMNTPSHAHQHIIPFRAFVVLCVYIVSIGCQLLLNLLSHIASFFNANWFGMLVRPAYVCNILNIIFTLTATLGWIPTGGFVDLLSNFIVVETSQLITLMYFNSILVVLISLSAFLPIRLMNELLHHYDSAKVTAALATPYLISLLRSPDVERRAFVTRVFAYCALAVGLIPTTTTMYDIVIDRYFRTRLALSSAQHFLGLLTIVATVLSTYRYNQTAMFTIVIVLLTTVSFACVQDLVFWLIYRAVTVANATIYKDYYVILQMISSSLWMVMLLILGALVYALKRHVQDCLPLRAVENLNQHYDGAVVDEIKSPRYGETYPLLISDSEYDSLPLQ